MKVRKSMFFPHAERSEMLEVPVSCILLRHPQGNVLFDTGCHPSVAVNAEARWGGLAKSMIPIMSPQNNVLNDLEAVGLTTDDIDVVICSHLHPDHCGCNGFFRKATFFAHANELEAARSPDAAIAGYFAADWDHPMPIKSVEKETDVMGDGRIVLLPLPGHTPGTMGALVDLERSGEFLLASDSLSLKKNLELDVIPRNTWNAEKCAESFSEIRRIEASGVQIICGHDPLQWSSLRKGLEYYD